MTLLRIRGQCFEAENQVSEHKQERYVIELESFCLRPDIVVHTDITLHEFITLYPRHNFVFPSRTPISDEIKFSKRIAVGVGNGETRMVFYNST